MKSMLEFLFSSEIVFPGSWMEEGKLGQEQDKRGNLEIQIQARLGEEQAELWKAHQEKSQKLEVQRGRMEFERGFLTAANLALEIFHRSQEG